MSNKTKIQTVIPPSKEQKVQEVHRRFILQQQQRESIKHILLDETYHKIPLQCQNNKENNTPESDEEMEFTNFVSAYRTDETRSFIEQLANTALCHKIT